jgi:hypothetical protein
MSLLRPTRCQLPSQVVPPVARISTYDNTRGTDTAKARARCCIRSDSTRCSWA